MNRADFSPDGSLLATVGDDGTLRLWKVNPPGSTLSSGPVWRAPLLLTGNDDSVVAFTHHGWENLDEGKAFEPIANSWRRAVEVARRASVSRNGRTLCVQTLDDALEIWDTRKDRIVWRKSVEDVSEVQAAGQGCAVLAGEGALLLTRDKRSIELGGAASALGWYEAGHELLLVSDGKVLVYEPNGLLKDSHTAGQGVTAVLALEAGDHEDGPLVLVGKQEGSVECVVCLSGSTRLRPLAPLRDEARSPVLKMAAGPPGTLAVGYANGEVGLWDIGNGVRLHHAKLHGPILHFLFANDRLYLASELGDTMVWDLSVYKREYCELLSEVREAVPLVWKDGRPVQETRPREHPCLEARAR